MPERLVREILDEYTVSPILSGAHLATK